MYHGFNYLSALYPLEDEYRHPSLVANVITRIMVSKSTGSCTYRVNWWRNRCSFVSLQSNYRFWGALCKVSVSLHRPFGKICKSLFGCQITLLCLKRCSNEWYNFKCCSLVGLAGVEIVPVCMSMTLGYDWQRVSLEKRVDIAGCVSFGVVWRTHQGHEAPHSIVSCNLLKKRNEIPLQNFISPCWARPLNALGCYVNHSALFGSYSINYGSG